MDKDKDKEWKTVNPKEIIPFFKTDKEIMDFLKLNFFDKELCLFSFSYFKSEDSVMDLIREGVYISRDVQLVGLSFLKNPKNIFTVMKQYGFAKDICEIGLAGSRLENRTQDELREYLTESEYNYEICKAGIPYLRADDEIVRIATQECNSYWDITPLAIPYLRQWENVAILLRNKNYWVDACIAALRFMTTEKRIFSVMEETRYDKKFVKAAIPLLKLWEKNDSQLVRLLNRAKLSPVMITAVCEVLNFTARSEEEIIKFLKKYKYNCFIEEAIKYFSRDTILLLLETHDYQISFCVQAVIALKSEDDKMMLMAKTRYNQRVCHTGIMFLKKQKNILLIVEKTGYEELICGLGIFLLKRKKDIISVLEKYLQLNEFLSDYQVTRPILNVNGILHDQLMLFLKATNYDEHAQKVCLPILRKLHHLEED